MSRGACVIRFTNCSRLDHEFATRCRRVGEILSTVAYQQDTVGILHAGELEIRVDEGLVLATGRALTLSVREFDLLVALAHRVGTITRREELYRVVWGGELRNGDRSVDVYVSKLRGKLERAMPDRRFIHTHPGFGYRFQPQPTVELVSAASELSASELSRNVHNGVVLD